MKIEEDLFLYFCLAFHLFRNRLLTFSISHLNNDQKQKRHSDSTLKELIRVTWNPTWEPEELKNTWDTFQQQIMKFESLQDEPNLSIPTADQFLDKLERQGFDKSDRGNSWIQELDTELRNKVTFDVHPTNPEADIQPTGSCEF